MSSGDDGNVRTVFHPLSWQDARSSPIRIRPDHTRRPPEGTLLSAPSKSVRPSTRTPAASTTHSATKAPPHCACIVWEWVSVCERISLERI